MWHDVDYCFWTIGRWSRFLEQEDRSVSSLWFRSCTRMKTRTCLRICSYNAKEKQIFFVTKKTSSKISMISGKDPFQPINGPHLQAMKCRIRLGKTVELRAQKAVHSWGMTGTDAEILNSMRKWLFKATSPLQYFNPSSATNPSNGWWNWVVEAPVRGTRTSRTSASKKYPWSAHFNV